MSVMTLHVVIGGETERDTVLEKVRAYLEGQWRVGHATIQIEQSACSGQTGTAKRHRNPGIP